MDRSLKFTLALGALLSMAGVAHAQERPDSRVRVQRVEGGTMLVRQVAGDYSQHPQVFAELMRVRDRDYATVGDCFGIYPMDPDAVSSPSELRWSIGVRVAPKASQKALQRPAGGYRLERLPDVQAAVIDTRVERAATDGLAIIRWMVENGYVQVAATRMEYRSHEDSPMLIPARIVVPVKKRPSGLQLPSVAAVVDRIRRADYEGDRAALQRLYDELAPFLDDRWLAVTVRYWRGFAAWRRALNGFNESADRSELERDLDTAVSEFRAAVARDETFADAKIAAASCLLNILFLHRNDAARVRELLQAAVPLLEEAEAAEPDNPRLLWVLGANRWNLPPERGGGQAKAIETYEKGLELARQPRARASGVLSPSWGEPELLMNLAWSKLNGTDRNLEAAERYAQAALALVPHWHYVRDILLPQIQSAKIDVCRRNPCAPTRLHQRAIAQPSGLFVKHAFATARIP